VTVRSIPRAAGRSRFLVLNLAQVDPKPFDDLKPIAVDEREQFAANPNGAWRLKS